MEYKERVAETLKVLLAHPPEQRSSVPAEIPGPGAETDSKPRLSRIVDTTAEDIGPAFIITGARVPKK